MNLIQNIVTGVLGVTGAVTQIQTNGFSLLGTLTSPHYPEFMTNNPLPNGYPWGLRTASGTNPYNEYPVTGVIRPYEFTINRGEIAPDGYPMSVILVNGQFPGPTIEANWGDTIQVTVHNNITGPEEGTSIHWHGFLQKGTQYYDGSPAAQQCPIAPGRSFTYQFNAQLYGSSWYHSHYSAQYAGGLMGPIIIHGPTNMDYDIDLGPVFLTDWYHTPYFEIVESVIRAAGNPAPRSDNNLINGKMNFDCSNITTGSYSTCNNNAGVSKFKFTTGKTHRLRLINAGAEGLQRFSIDEHNMTVIANDFVPVVPYTTNVVTLGIGQRTDVLVTANVGTPTSTYWMRSNISTICSLPNQPNALAAVYYDEANINQAPTSNAWNVPDPGTCANDDLALTTPYYSMPASTPTVTRNLDVSNFTNATGSFLWTMDGTSFRANYNNPILLLAAEGNTTYPEEWNVKDFGSNTTIRIVINNLSPISHPMHMHGHNIQILAEGTGAWDGTTVFQPSNPQRRDVQQLRGYGHLVFQFNADNPGVWPLHCHIAWHVSGGLYVNILERPSDLLRDMEVPLVLNQTCVDWEAYTNANVVDQIDSGV